MKAGTHFDLILRFYKYHGTGNDFILIDNRDDHFIPVKEIISQLCHRRFGIGADGLITLNNVRGYDFGMRYFNSDGQESTMCGNGGRCVVAFADYLSLTEGNSRFLAADGEHSGSILSQAGNTYMVRLNMNDVNEYRNLGGDFIINTGSPHLVRFTLNVDKIDVVKEGRALRYLADFQPEGINVNFVEDEGGQIFVRTYERGVEDETLSCGTGVTASSLAYATIKGLDKGKIFIRTNGGKLSLSFRRNGRLFTKIKLEGPAIKVYDGTIIL